MIIILKIPIFILLIISKNVFALEPYTAEYKFKNNGMTFAKSIHKLQRLDDSWSFITNSTTVGIFSLKHDERMETSKFSIVNSKPLTFNYEYYQEKSSKIQSIVTLRNQNNILISYIDDKMIMHNIKYQTDRLLTQVFGYKYIKDDYIPTLDKSRERMYRFTLVGFENINTIFGDIKTIVVKKIIDKSKRSTITWYAIDYDYLPVKIEQYRLDELKFTAEISDYNK